MDVESKSFSFYAWLTGAACDRKGKRKCVEHCASCRLPLERLQSIFAPGGTRTYCQVCRAMIECADTPYLQAVQEQCQEEQKRKKILMPGGNAAMKADLAQMKAEHAKSRADRKAKLQEKISLLDSKIQTQLQKAKERRQAAEREAQAKVQVLKAKAAAAKAKAS